MFCASRIGFCLLWLPGFQQFLFSKVVHQHFYSIWFLFLHLYDLFSISLVFSSSAINYFLTHPFTAVGIPHLYSFLMFFLSSMFHSCNAVPAETLINLEDFVQFYIEFITPNKCLCFANEFFVFTIFI